MDTSSNPMAQNDAVEQRFAPAASALPEQSTTHNDAPACGNVFNIEGTDIREDGTIAGVDVLEALKDVIDPELGINIVDLGSDGFGSAFQRCSDQLGVDAGLGAGPNHQRWT